MDVANVCGCVGKPCFEGEESEQWGRPREGRLTVVPGDPCQLLCGLLGYCQPAIQQPALAWYQVTEVDKQQSASQTLYLFLCEE